MDMDVQIGDESFTINIPSPHSFDLDHVIGKIRDAGTKAGYDLSDMNLEGLIPKMIRGVAGCEAGCPSNAKGLVREGFDGFNIYYVEGGILSSETRLIDGKSLTLKVFPEFG